MTLGDGFPDRADDGDGVLGQSSQILGHNGDEMQSDAPIYVRINYYLLLLLYITARRPWVYFDSIDGYLLDACSLLKRTEEE